MVLKISATLLRDSRVHTIDQQDDVDDVPDASFEATWVESGSRRRCGVNLHIVLVLALFVCVGLGANACSHVSKTVVDASDVERVDVANPPHRSSPDRGNDTSSTSSRHR